jgi:PAS domain S-box-containing protein
VSDERLPEAVGPHAAAAEPRERDAALRRGESRDAGHASSDGAPTNAATRLFAALADNVRDYAIFLLSWDGIITYWGEGARLIKWWTRNQAEGAHLRLLYPDGGAEDGTAEAHLDHAAEHGEYTGEGHRVRSDGSTFWAGVTLTALWDDAGTLLGFAKVTRDLTARRAADLLLQESAEAAERARQAAVMANMAKSGFLATMSHEIRTPINAVLGYLDLLEMEIDGPMTPSQQRHVTRARASAHHLLSLVTDVLDFSRIEADRTTVARTAVRVGNVVADAIGLLAPQARERRIEIADAVSGFAAGLAAWGDEPRVRQILVNLLGNAVKFTLPRNGEPGRITVSAGTAAQASPDAQLGGEGPWVYIRVEDTGSGIPTDRLGPIFEAFVQADMSLTRTQGGTGLGLAISRRLARLMNGDVTVRSEMGVGSTFLLWLPAAPVESLSIAGHEDPCPTAGGDPSAKEGEEGAGAALRAVANVLLGELEHVLHGYVARLRTDEGTPSARTVSEAQIEDHLASFLADLASSLRSLGEPIHLPAGESMATVQDATAIQHLVAERHGAQRARLGWSELEVRREFEILREELSAAVRRTASSYFSGPDRAARAGEAERALELLRQFLAVAERTAVESMHRDQAGRVE